MPRRLIAKNADPSKIIANGRSQLEPDEFVFEDTRSLPDGERWDDEFYVLDPGPPMQSVRKPQVEIDAIIAARAQAKADAQAKKQAAKAEYDLQKLDTVTYAQINAWVNNQIPDQTFGSRTVDFSGVRTAVKILGKGLLALWKKNDQSD